jgi:hypothetical protein
LKETNMADHLDLRRLWRYGAIAAAVATAVNLTLLALGRITGGTLVVAYGPEPVSMQVGAAEVTVFTIVAMVLGLAVTTVVARRRPHRLRTMQAIGAAVAVVSLFQPLVVDTDTTTRIALATMHLVAGAAFVAGLRRSRSAATAAPHPMRTADGHG